MAIQQPEVSHLIKELRRRTGLTQQELARKIGVSFTSVNRWEKQKQMPIPLGL
ncbi:helix-turn-helix domain-containing protein [Egbenema bharatensis]|uniref:helix-turn-helix domain-containing protein n=1 Tax=Egbenema bharatensis TaxID=3463334 RepID=UPI003A85F924